MNLPIDIVSVNLRRIGIKILESERLLLEQAALDDGPFFFELLNSPTWIEYIGDRGIKTKDDAEDYIQKSLLNSYKTKGYGLFKMVLKGGNKPIGICGFLKRDYLEHPDIGFAILPEYESRGFTFEAAKAAMEYGQSKLKFKTIFAITTEKNIRSRNLLKKIGLSEIDKIIPEKTKEELLLYSTD